MLLFCSNAFHTLFVGRLSHDTTEKKLRREFEQFGSIKSIKLVVDSQTDKSRGYAFIEFENEQDMTTAYRKSEGRKIDGRRIVVDVERGRTVRNWRPMRFGGGLGGRVTRDERVARDEAFGGGGRNNTEKPAERPKERSRDRRDPPSNTGRERSERDHDHNNRRDDRR